MKRIGSGMPSNTQPMARQAGSSARKETQSATSTSEELPVVSRWLTETPRITACASEKPSAPDWLTRPTAWGSGTSIGGGIMKVTPALVRKFSMPMQFGPTMRMPAARPMAARRRCAAMSSSRAVSAKPEA